MSAPDGEPTYRDVAQWLPTDVREAIEAGTPCPITKAAHYWHHSRGEVRQFGVVEPIRIIEHWTCGCGIARTTDPQGER